MAILLSAMAGGTFAIATLTLGHLLDQDAVLAGRSLAEYLAKNVADLDGIAAGQKPSEASLRLLEQARHSSPVRRFRIFDTQGRPAFASPGPDARGIDAGEPSRSRPDASAARVMAQDGPIVVAADAAPPDRPAYDVKAYVPVVVNDKPVAVVEADVDQAEKRDGYRATLAAASAALNLLAALAYGIPALAWSRHKDPKGRSSSHIDYLAHYNAMTGLPNRNSMNETLQEALAALPARGGGLAMHHIDVDRLKDVNDSHGHDVGDSLIRTAAKRLCDVVSPADFVAHLGGDEFAVVQAQVSDPSDAEKLARKITDAVSKPFMIDGHEIATTASIGVALAPAHGNDAVRLLKCADLALYKSKADGRNCVRLFAPEMDAELEARLRLEKMIRDAVANDGFELFFQPAVDMPDQRLVGFEALLRLRAPDGAHISPTLFIPMAEEMGLIGKIGTWVLREACRTAATWPPHLRVAVNLSPAQFANESLSDIVAAALAETSLDPQRLELEITEGLLLSDSPSIMAELRKIKALGAAIVMDDFGTGYSSLSYLWRFPFDKIKIDRTFMKALEADHHADAKAIVRTIITLGRSLNMAVTIEGVEKEPQVAFVRDAGCDQIQGFYFGRPMPVTNVADHILADMKRPPCGSAEPEACVRRAG